MAIVLGVLAASDWRQPRTAPPQLVADRAAARKRRAGGIREQGSRAAPRMRRGNGNTSLAACRNIVWRHVGAHGDVSGGFTTRPSLGDHKHRPAGHGTSAHRGAWPLWTCAHLARSGGRTWRRSGASSARTVALDHAKAVGAPDDARFRVWRYATARQARGAVAMPMRSCATQDAHNGMPMAPEPAACPLRIKKARRGCRATS
jgi:hypothetical protein